MYRVSFTSVKEVQLFGLQNSWAISSITVVINRNLTGCIPKKQKVCRFKCLYFPTWTRESTRIIPTNACISVVIRSRRAEHARANVMLDTRSIRARKPLFYANLAAHAARVINYSLGRVRLWTAQRGRERERYAFPFYSAFSTSVLFVAPGAVNTTKYLPLIKPTAGDKYLSDATDPPTNLFDAFDLVLENNEKEKKKFARVFPL